MFLVYPLFSNKIEVAEDVRVALDKEAVLWSPFKLRKFGEPFWLLALGEPPFSVRLLSRLTVVSRAGLCKFRHGSLFSKFNKRTEFK